MDYKKIMDEQIAVLLEINEKLKRGDDYKNASEIRENAKAIMKFIKGQRKAANLASGYIEPPRHGAKPKKY